jgi:hypothetical protein
MTTKTVATALNPRNKRFCELYASLEEFFENGRKSYLKVYGKDKKMSYMTAMVNASQLLRKPKISEYINQLLEVRGLNDQFVDKQLEFLVTQHADFKTKLGAIHEYNQLKRHIDPEGNKTLVLVVTDESAARYGSLPSMSPASKFDS